MSNYPLTPYGNKSMVTPIANVVNYQYNYPDALRKNPDGKNVPGIAFSTILINFRIIVISYALRDYQ
jgi:hypothetical protein